MDSTIDSLNDLLKTINELSYTQWLLALVTVVVFFVIARFFINKFLIYKELDKQSKLEDSVEKINSSLRHNNELLNRVYLVILKLELLVKK